MPRRVHVSRLTLGMYILEPDAAHYLLNVLRLVDGTDIEPFDSEGNRGRATIHVSPVASLDVTEILPPCSLPSLTVASAVPKGDRADYLVEKLAELGVAAWIPLRTARSVVHPDGPSKFDRWNRIAQEATRQSHAPRVMRIGPLTPLPSLDVKGAWFGTTAPGCLPAVEAPPTRLILIGPEGGWTPEEESDLTSRCATPITLGQTILRTETATLVAASCAFLRTP